MLIQVIADTILKHNLHQKKFVIAFSGGVDSTALCYLFYQLAKSNLLPQKPIFRAVYINHNLSPNASAWKQNCYDFCAKFNIEFKAISVVIDGSNNLESKARKARYQAFKEDLKLDEVLVCAHHQQDLVETFLLNLKRGAGLDGLSAMPELSFKHGFALFRPLLSQTKFELEQILKKYNLPYINDESNADNSFDRNFLRNEILPLLNDRWQGFNNNVARSANNLSQVKQLLNSSFNGDNLPLSLTNRLDLTVLKHKNDSEINFILRNFIAKYQKQMPSFKVLEQIKRQFLHGASPLAQINLIEGSLKIYQNYLYFCTKSELNPKLIPSNFSLSLKLNQNIELPLNLGDLKLVENQLIWNNGKQTKSYPLDQNIIIDEVMVKFNQSDKFIFNGLRRDLKKIYQSQQIPSWKRHNHPQIYINNQPVIILL